MNKAKLLFLIVELSLFWSSFKVAYALFTGVAANQNNTYLASASFPNSFTNHVVISEVQINGATTSQDFIEIYNPTSTTIAVGGWQLKKRVSTGTESSIVVINAGTNIASHRFFLWANNSGTFATSIGADEKTGSTLAGDNSIALLDNSNTIVDQVAWGTGTNQFVEGSPYPTNPGGGQSIERKGPGIDSNNNSTDFSLRAISQPQNSTSPPQP